MGVYKCSMFCCTLLNVHSSIATILMEKRELIALLYLSSWCHVMVERLFLAVPRGCLRFVIVVFPDHTHLLFLEYSFLLMTFLVLLIWTQHPSVIASVPKILSLTISRMGCCMPILFCKHCKVSYLIVSMPYLCPLTYFQVFGT